MHPSALGHDIELPRTFGHGLDHAIAVCRKCGAMWKAYYGQRGLEFRPWDEKAKKKCEGKRG